MLSSNIIKNSYFTFIKFTFYRNLFTEEIRQTIIFEAPLFFLTPQTIKRIYFSFVPVFL